MEQHLCHAVNCNVRVPPTRLMCARHWHMVPEAIRRAVWKEYRPGQCDDKAPTQLWVDAARAAINSVAKQEGEQPLPDTEEILKTLEQLLKKRDNDNV